VQVAAASLDPDETYRLLSSVVVPRPIAWITSLSPEGVVNLAPFSCFTFVSNRPPLIGVTIGRKVGRRKDTGANIHATREFVINIGDATQMEQIHLSSTEHPPDVSEVDLLGLRTAPSIAIGCPRLADAPVAMECRLHRVVEFGTLGSEFVVGEVVQFHFREGLFRNGKVETAELRPVCRLGGPNYATLGSIVTLEPIALTPRSAVSPNPP
jgi:flavin reductase (DIM6/NTAB) family NADH-FMN oxidoreductase RutF